jgi:hypothetical protein
MLDANILLYTSVPGAAFTLTPEDGVPGSIGSRMPFI